MKTKTIIFLLAISFLSIGFVLCIGAMIATGFDFQTLSNSEQFYEKQFETESNTGKTIYINDSNKNINIIPSEDQMIHIRYHDNEREHYTITDEENKLSVTYKQKKHWYEYIGFHFWFEQHTTTISIPPMYSGDIEIITSNGRIDLSDVELSGRLTLDTSNGGIYTKSVKSTGKNKMQVYSSNGRIEFSNVQMDGELTADTSNGKIIMDDVSGESITLSTSNGPIELNRIDVTQNLDCSTSNAGITGNITGYDSSFSITSHTSNGSNNLPEKSIGEGKELNVNTSNGSIDILFRGD